MSSFGIPACADDWREKARRRLPRFFFDFIDGGANDEQTLHRNTADFARVQLRQRVLRDVSRIETGTTLFGSPASLPLALAPVGMTGLFARRGEVLAKRAADAAGLPYTLSTMSICSMEEVAAVSDIPFWFQLYMLRDRGIVREMLQRAWGVGVRVLVFTVDLAVPGLRRRDVRNGITGAGNRWQRFRAVPLAAAAAPFWAWDVGLRGRPLTYGNIEAYLPGRADQAGIRAWGARQMDSSVTWADIAWLREVWQGPLVIKGILDPQDAMMAVEIGAEGIVVSNHGGRQLDGVASTISALPRIA
ncbi:MAG: L-lactate dehydrogenase, partial [Pararhodobacter sp.]|nr:L-lactate dehydrogenase [Pararhodobacter sp.]